MNVYLPPSNRAAQLGRLGLTQTQHPGLRDVIDPMGMTALDELDEEGLSGWRDVLGTILGAAGSILSKPGQTGPPSSAQQGSAANIALHASCIAQLSQGVLSQECCQFGAQFCPGQLVQTGPGAYGTTVVTSAAAPTDWSRYMPWILLGGGALALITLAGRGR